MPPAIGLVLAAGQARRFGADKRQAIAPCGSPLLHAVLRLYRPWLDRLIVVIGPDDAFGQQACALFAAQPVINPDPLDGMGRSLAVGVSRLMGEQADGVLLALADMPWIAATTIAQILANRHVGRPVAPRCQGEIGFPRWIPAGYFAPLAALRGDHGARSVIDWAAAHLIDCDDPGLLLDVDRPEDLDRPPAD